MSTLALLVLMMLGPALAHASCVRWEGTITSDAGMSGIFRAVARVPPPVLPGAVAAGPFHCRGPGCPGRHGLFTDTYLITEVEVAGQFEPGRTFPEEEVNRILARFHPDVAALRRYLVDEEFLERREGSYWRAGGTFHVD